MKRETVVPMLLLSVVAACGAEPTDDGTMLPVPQVLAIEPADNAVGVRADAPIVLTFSEPMDAATVETAIDAPKLGGMQFIWDLAQTKLTIVPTSPLVYAEGTGDSPDAVAANVYELALASAQSKLGVALEQPIAIKFATLKRMTTTAGIDDGLTIHVHSTGQTGIANSDLRVGDGTSNVSTRGLVSFNLSSLSDRAVEIETAAFNAQVMAIVGEPYTIDPSMMAYHVTYADPVAGYSTPALGTVGAFAQDGTTNVSQDVTAQLDDDLAHRIERAQHSQFRLQFDAGNNGDGGQDYAQFSRATLSLSYTYLSP